MELVPLSVLTELLSDPEGSKCSDVDEELRLALAAAGYPPDACEVTAADAVAMLEFLDAGIVRSTSEQRLASSGGFGRRNIRPPTSEGADG